MHPDSTAKNAAGLSRMRPFPRINLSAVTFNTISTFRRIITERLIRGLQSALGSDETGTQWPCRILIAKEFKRLGSLFGDAQFTKEPLTAPPQQPASP